MSMDWNLFWRRVRLWALVCLIAGDVANITLEIIGGQWFWASGFIAISLVIVIEEIVSYWTDHKTISTRYGEWIRTQPALALPALGCFIFAMLSLGVHLIGYGFKS